MNVREQRPMLAGAAFAGKRPSSVCRSPDGALLAFALNDDEQTAVLVCSTSANAGESPRELVRGGGLECREIAWSPDGTRLACRLMGEDAGSSDDRVLVIDVRGHAPERSFSGVAFAWARRGAVLYVANHESLMLERHDLDKGHDRPLADFHHHPSKRFEARIVPSPDGQRLAFSTRNVLEETSRVFVLGRQGGDLISDLLTWVPGCDLHCFPVWSPKGRSLGLYVIHESVETTGLVIVDGLEGDGEVYYEVERLEEPVSPLWEPDGRSMLIVQRHGALARLDLESRTPRLLLGAGRIAGTPRLHGGAIVLEGSDAVYQLDPS